jgi:hypothetical protein
MIYLEFAKELVPLVVLIFKEFFSAQAREREADRVFKIDQDNLRKIVDAAMQKWTERAAKDSIGAGNAWDIADEDLNKGEKRK